MAHKDVLKGYPGRKGASGVLQRILSLMPPHDRYIEPFLGSGFVMSRKIPAASTLAADVDADVMRAHRRHPLPGVLYVTKNVHQLLPSLKLTVRDLVYMDPPYHPYTRTKKKIYRHEMDDAAHRSLLSLALTLPAAIMISGYRCALYDDKLSGWYREDFRAGTRGGPRMESVWCNFKPGENYHDTRFIGGGFRERERIKRKKLRWARKFAKMSPIERIVIFDALQEIRGYRPVISDGAAGGIVGPVDTVSLTK